MKLKHLNALATDTNAKRYHDVRAQSLALAAPLSAADCQVQSMPDASPTSWHLAHTSWFFETFILEPFERNFKPHDPTFRVLFNSYYQQVGAQHPRPQRGLITRPSLDEIVAYRAAVDERVADLLRKPHDPEIDARIELGLQHEQQHQELLLTDIKHALSLNPAQPRYNPHWPLARITPLAPQWQAYRGGLVAMGHEGEGFAFDNETPKHQHFLRPYALSNRLVTHGEWVDFVGDGGYTDPRWWLSAGWDWVRAQSIQAPLYWQRSESAWSSFTLHGLVPIDAHTPVTHISYFEADAYARWASVNVNDAAGARLATEAEWEHAAAQAGAVAIKSGNFVESKALHPMPVSQVQHDTPMQLFGDVWEWTSSSYAAYPGYAPWEGAIGEYNGKFMVNQYVLRGGSCVTPRSHIRASYRNFFPTDARWQFSGLRLARDVD